MLTASLVNLHNINPGSFGSPHFSENNYEKIYFLFISIWCCCMVNASWSHMADTIRRYKWTNITICSWYNLIHTTNLQCSIRPRRNLERVKDWGFGPFSFFCFLFFFFICVESHSSGGYRTLQDVLKVLVACKVTTICTI